MPFPARSFIAAASLAAALSLRAAPEALRFDFGSGPVAPGFVGVAPDTLFTPARGNGLLPSAGLVSHGSGQGDPLKGDALAGSGPFSFVVTLPEGNYDVTVHLGDPTAPADTTVKAESRRLMIESVRTAAGVIESRTFTVNIRQPQIGSTGRKVSLKERERGVAHWDDKLSLEFNGAHPAVAGLEIRRNDSALTVYIASDSTVTDQTGEPWCGWGQMLPRFFPAGVAVANHAESGLSLASFKGGQRLDKILSTLRAGDYVLIQFAHNDEKEKGENVGPFTTYAQSLRAYVDAIVAKGGKPVLVTPMYRRRFNDGKLTDTHGDYPVAVRQVAKEKNVPCVDLHAMSAKLFTALGPDASKLAFVHYKAGTFPGQDKDLKDDTHFSTYGGYELARCVVEGIRENVPELAKRLDPSLPRFNPSTPDEPTSFSLPPSPPASETRIPDGDGR